MLKKNKSKDTHNSGMHNLASHSLNSLVKGEKTVKNDQNNVAESNI